LPKKSKPPREKGNQWVIGSRKGLARGILRISKGPGFERFFRNLNPIHLLLSRSQKSPYVLNGDFSGALSMKPPNRLKKACQVLLFLGVSYLWVSIILFFGVGPIKTTFWGFHFVFIYLTDPIRISFLLILGGISFRVLDFLGRELRDFPRKSILSYGSLKTRLIRFGKKQIHHFDYRLLVVLFLGAIVRYWGIMFGLPESFCRPDEEIIVNTTLKFFQGDFNPDFFRYPTLYMYLLYAVFKMYLFIQNASGNLITIPD
jgi:hypothetical protein